MFSTGESLSTITVVVEEGSLGSGTLASEFCQSFSPGVLAIVEDSGGSVPSFWRKVLAASIIYNFKIIF